jgi:hypothetical protein
MDGPMSNNRIAAEGGFALDTLDAPATLASVKANPTIKAT